MISVVITKEEEIRCRGEHVGFIREGDTGVILGETLGRPVIMLSGDFSGKTLYLDEKDYEEVGEYEHGTC